MTLLEVVFNPSPDGDPDGSVQKKSRKGKKKDITYKNLTKVLARTRKHILRERKQDNSSDPNLTSSSDSEGSLDVEDDDDDRYYSSSTQI